VTLTDEPERLRAASAARACGARGRSRGAAAIGLGGIRGDPARGCRDFGAAGPRDPYARGSL